MRHDEQIARLQGLPTRRDRLQDQRRDIGPWLHFGNTMRPVIVSAASSSTSDRIAGSQVSKFQVRFPTCNLQPATRFASLTHQRRYHPLAVGLDELLLIAADVVDVDLVEAEVDELLDLRACSSMSGEMIMRFL